MSMELVFLKAQSIDRGVFINANCPQVPKVRRSPGLNGFACTILALAVLIPLHIVTFERCHCAC